MPNYTDKLGLVKPLETEYFDIEAHFNANSDLLDQFAVDKMTFKGSLATLSLLPTVNEVGDFYNVEENQSTYVWDGTNWVGVGSGDMSASNVTIDDVGTYYASENVEGALQEIGNDIITGEDDEVGTPPLINADRLDGKTWEDEVGTKTYTEQNVVTNGETVTSSLNKLDVVSKLIGLGGIHEQGTNFIQFESGIMFVFETITNSRTITTALENGGFRSSILNHPLPKTFVNEYVVISSNGDLISSLDVVTYLGGDNVLRIAWKSLQSDNTSRERIMHYLVIGTWK